MNELLNQDFSQCDPDWLELETEIQQITNNLLTIFNDKDITLTDQERDVLMDLVCNELCDTSEDGLFCPTDDTAYGIAKGADTFRAFLTSMDW